MYFFCGGWETQELGEKKVSNVLSIQRNASVNGPGRIDTFSLELRFGTELDGGVGCGRGGVESGAGEDAAFIVERYWLRGREGVGFGGWVGCSGGDG